MNLRTMSLSAFRIVRKLTILFGISFVAILCWGQPAAAQQGAQPSGRDASQRSAQKDVPTPGIPSTGFAGLDQYRASRIAMFTDDYGQLARYRGERGTSRSGTGP